MHPVHRRLRAAVGARQRSPSSSRMVLLRNSPISFLLSNLAKPSCLLGGQPPSMHRRPHSGGMGACTHGLQAPRHSAEAELDGIRAYPGRVPLGCQEAETLQRSQRDRAAAAGAHARDLGALVAAVLYNGLARYETRGGSPAITSTPLAVCPCGVPELVEASARAGDTELARDTLERLAVDYRTPAARSSLDSARRRPGARPAATSSIAKRSTV